MYVDETSHISIVTESHCNNMEKGGSGIYTQVATGLNETKEGGETSKSKILRVLKRGSPTCIKSTGDKIGIPDGWVIYRLGDVVMAITLNPTSSRRSMPSHIIEKKRGCCEAVCGEMYVGILHMKEDTSHHQNKHVCCNTWTWCC